MVRNACSFRCTERGYAVRGLQNVQALTSWSNFKRLRVSGSLPRAVTLSSHALSTQYKYVPYHSLTIHERYFPWTKLRRMICATERLSFFGELYNKVPGPSSRAVWSVGLRPLACWDRGFESHRGHGCLSVVSVVCCQVEVSATSWSPVQRSPTDCGASLCVI